MLNILSHIKRKLRLRKFNVTKSKENMIKTLKKYLTVTQNATNATL